MNLKIDGVAKDDNGVIYAIKGKRETANSHYIFHDANMIEDFILVLEYFRNNQPEPGFVRKWEVPALTRFIKILFKGNIHHKRAHNLALLFKMCSQMASEVF
jgi:hypothetical protein